MRKSVIWLALVLTAITGQVQALEVGTIQVRSYLNEPLVATIPVQVANIQERNSLAATLAAQSEYVARGLPPLASPDDLIIQVVEGRALEQMLIEVRSLSSIEAPFVNLVLQLVWDGGNAVDEFTVLLDPKPLEIADEAEDEFIPADMDPLETDVATDSEYKAEEDPVLRKLAEDMGAETTMPASGKPPQVVIRKISPDAYLSGQDGSQTAASGYTGPAFTGDSYGPVAAGETLWGIASKVRPNLSVSMAQVMEAIFQANPQAFSGTYETLKKGATLSIPSADSMQAAMGRSPVKASKSEKVESESLAGQASDAPAIWMTPEQSAKADQAQLEKKGGLITKSAKAPAALTAKDQAPVESEKTAAVAEPSTATPDQQKQEAIAGKVDYSETVSATTADKQDSAAQGQGEDVPLAQESGESDESLLQDEPGTDSAATEALTDSAADEGGEVDEPIIETTEERPFSTMALGAVILIVLLLTYWWYRRRRATEVDESAFADNAPPIGDLEDVDAPAEAVYMDQGAAAEITEVGLPASPAEAEDRTESGEAGVPQESTAPGNDAIEQATTYLSYGLYESAAETLQKGIEEEPQRADYRRKLLETYETAGNSEDFVAAVEDWEASEAPLDDDTRRVITEMGQRVAPGVALFAAGSSEPESEGDNEIVADVADQEKVMDSPRAAEEEELPLPDFDLNTPDTESAPQASQEMVADLDLSDAEEGKSQKESEADSVALNLDVDELPELKDDITDEVSEDLELPSLDLDLDAPSSKQPVEEQQGSMDLALDDLETEITETDEIETADIQDETPSGEYSIDLSEEEAALDSQLDEGLTADSGSVIEGEGEGEIDESEYDVKIDLAQAYLDMGEPDLARSLLEEVTSGGNPTQQGTAQTMLAQID